MSDYESKKYRKKPIVWDTGAWRNCFHLNPKEKPDIHTERKMGSLAKKFRRYDCMWGVVNPGNALVHSVHRTKREADKERKEHACAYVVVRVIVTPQYTDTRSLEESCRG